MFTAGKRKYVVIGITVFLILAVTGLLSGVSVQALLIRAVLAALFFVLLTYVFISIIVTQVLSPDELPVELLDELSSEAAVTDTTEQYKGKQVDIVLPAEETLFEPLTPHQIDPQINKIINEDPERIAAMVKKMGLDE